MNENTKARTDLLFSTFEARAKRWERNKYGTTFGRVVADEIRVVLQEFKTALQENEEAKRLTMESKHWHAMGKRDAMAEMLMTLRAYGTKSTVRLCAEEVLKHEATNPHAKWALENLENLEP